jgi:hypothetical protein
MGQTGAIVGASNELGTQVDLDAGKRTEGVIHPQPSYHMAQGWVFSRLHLHSTCCLRPTLQVSVVTDEAEIRSSGTLVEGRY